jgi:hypothetical protein
MKLIQTVLTWSIVAPCLVLASLSLVVMLIAFIASFILCIPLLICFGVSYAYMTEEEKKKFLSK